MSVGSHTDLYRLMDGLQIRYDIAGLKKEIAIYDFIGLDGVDGLEIRHDFTLLVWQMKYLLDLMKILVDFDKRFDIFRMNI